MVTLHWNAREIRNSDNAILKIRTSNTRLIYPFPSFLNSSNSTQTQYILPWYEHTLATNLSNRNQFINFRFTVLYYHVKPIRFCLSDRISRTSLPVTNRSIIPTEVKKTSSIMVPENVHLSNNTLLKRNRYDLFGSSKVTDPKSWKVTLQCRQSLARILYINSPTSTKYWTLITVHLDF